MKPERRLSLLRITAAAAVAVFIYTGAVTLRVILFKTDGGITAFLLFLFAVLSGYFAGRVFSGASPAISTAPICPDTGTNTYKSDRDPAGSDAPGISASGPKRGALEFISFMLNLKINSRLLSHMIAWLIMKFLGNMGILWDLRKITGTHIRTMLGIHIYVLLYLLKIIVGIPTTRGSEALLGDKGAMSLIGFDVETVKEGLCKRGDANQHGEGYKKNTLCHECVYSIRQY